jgi:hypothetical protein
VYDKAVLKPILSISFFDFLFKDDEMTQQKFVFSGICARDCSGNLFWPSKTSEAKKIGVQSPPLC